MKREDAVELGRDGERRDGVGDADQLAGLKQLNDD
jgi:hypothetical protein